MQPLSVFSTTTFRHTANQAIKITANSMLALASRAFCATKSEFDFLAEDKVLRAEKNLRNRLIWDIAYLLDNDANGIFLASNQNSQLYANRAVQFLLDCEKKPQKGPSALSIVALAADEFGLQTDTSAMKAATTASILAEVPNNTDFHNNFHYRKVLWQTLRLIKEHNTISDPEDQFNKDDIALMITAACIHDLGHDGKTNGRGDEHRQYRLEDKSFAMAKPFLEKAGLNEDQIKDLQILLKCTDVTPLGDPNSPANHLKRVFKGHDTELPEALSRLKDNKKLQTMALMLHTADVATSAALTKEMQEIEASHLAAELKVDSIAQPEASRKFISNETDFKLLPAANAVYGDNSEKILEIYNDCIRRSHNYTYTRYLDIKHKKRDGYPLSFSPRVCSV